MDELRKLRKYVNAKKILDAVKKGRLNFNKGLDALVKKDKDGYWIYYAGRDWKQFDYEKGLDALIKKDKTGRLIFLAGTHWEQFDFKKGFDELIKIDKDGLWIYNAGMDWKQFNYNKGLDELKKLVHKYYYNRALKDWPKGIELSKEITKEIRKTAIKDPNRKKFKLKEWINEENLEDMSGEKIYKAGKDWKEFDYNKGLDELIKKDETGRWIYNAGMDWKKFNYEKGLDELIKKDKDGRWIYRAGRDWEQFDFKKGFYELIKKDKNDEWVYTAGAHWKQFDYNKGLDELVKKDKDGQWIFHAGMEWKQFNYNKGLDALKNKNYYDYALKYWPKGIKASKEEIEKLRKTAIKYPNKKKFKLKEGKISMDFKDYLEEKELKEFEEELNEDVGQAIANALGYTATGLAFAFGASLLAYAGVKTVGGIINIWRKIFKKAKDIIKPPQAKEVLTDIRTDAKVRQEKRRLDNQIQEYEDELKDVYIAIGQKDWDEAKAQFLALDRKLQNNPDVHKAIIIEVTKVMDEPPIYVSSPGSPAYQAIKKIINIRVARAAAEATAHALKKISQEE